MLLRDIASAATLSFPGVCFSYYGELMTSTDEEQTPQHVGQQRISSIPAVDDLHDSFIVTIAPDCATLPRLTPHNSCQKNG